MTMNTRTTWNARAPMQQAAMTVGAVFLLVGLLGFVPGITTGYDTMEFASHGSEARLLGVFQISVLHNLVHLAFGAAGVAMARTASAARTFLLAGGAVYLVLWVYGMVVGHHSSANFVPLNTADDWLHFVLGIGMLTLGTVLTRPRPSAPGV